MNISFQEYFNVVDDCRLSVELCHRLFKKTVFESNITILLLLLDNVFLYLEFVGNIPITCFNMQLIHHGLQITFNFFPRMIFQECRV